MSKKKVSDIFQFLVLFALAYMLSQMALRMYFPEQFGGEKPTGIVMTAQDTTLRGGHHPILYIENNTEEDLELLERCPMPPVDIFGVHEERRIKLIAEDTALPCEDFGSVEVGSTVILDLAPWKYSLFGEYGLYEAVLPGSDDVSVTFSIYEPGMVVKLFRTFITKPFLNFLIFITSLLPGYSLGLGIIILTVLVKLVLFFPTQHALEGQKKMQAVQPQLQALKKKYANDPQRMQQETVKIWRDNKVNPFGSCLPMLLQFPVLIGLFFVIRDGAVLELSRHLIYPMYQNLPWTFGTDFLIFDLTKPNWTVFPVLLMVLQFAQMKLSFALKKKKGEKEEKKKIGEMDSQEMQQKMMLYVLPIMIGFFAIQFPAAVSLYWGVSTVFAIGQQLVVNKRT
jgi:YidC/Oxa1 family membrane protein insertase